MTRKAALLTAALALGSVVGGLFLVVLVAMQVQSTSEEYAASCPPVTGSDSNVIPAVDLGGDRFSTTQLRNAAAVVAEGRRRGVSDQAIVIALAAAHQESRFLNFANDGRGSDLQPDQRGIERSLDLPHDAVGTDHGSLGVFQQQWPWWGEMSELLDPTAAAGKFYEALTQVRTWQDMPVTAASQRVQHSAYPDAYADDEAVAVRLLNELGGGDAVVDVAGETTAVSDNCLVAMGQCAPTGSSVEQGLTPDAARVLRCAQQTFGQLSVLGVGERLDNPASDHPSGRAVDILVSDWQSSSGRARGDQIAAWVQDNAAALGVRYVIWRGQIWSAERSAEGWRPYGHPSEASNPTARHMDHVHVSVHGNAGTGFGGGGAVVFPLPRESGYVDRHNWGNQSSRWARGHTGTDFSVACGTPVLAATAGTVSIRTDQAWSGRWLVQVGTGDGQLTTWYAHMQNVDVVDGQTVGAGSRLGEVGSEGNSTGCHLHFEVHPTGGSTFARSRSGHLVASRPGRSVTTCATSSYSTSMASRKKNANGEGTAYRRPNGNWSAQLYVTESGGRRVRRTIYGESRQAVQRQLSDLRDRSDSGRPIPSADLRLEGYLQEWLTQIVAVRVRGNTLAAYRYNIERYLLPDLGQKKLARLSARELRLYFEDLKQRGVGARTVKYVHSTLRAALEDAVREELLEKNVAKLVRVPQPVKSEPLPLSVDEVAALLKSSSDDRLYPMFVVIALLGLRRSEVLGLRWEDVDLDGGFLQVRRGLQRIDGKIQVLPTKTARSRRTIPLPTFVATVLQAHRATQTQERMELAERWPDQGFVFTTPIGTSIDPRNCTRVVQAACKKAGVRVVRLHDFRHGCVSVLLNLGVPPRTAMDIVGHSTIEMTMNVYGHVSLDEKREALDKLAELFEVRQS